MSFYDFSVGVAADTLNSLTAILKKAESAPNAASFPEARLVEDMLPLSFQIHMVTDLACKVAARLTGVEPPTLERDSLKTFADFYARIDVAKEHLSKASKETVNSRQNETVTISLGPGKSADLSGQNYVTGYVLPNLYFHTTTAYNIIRKNGVEIGKLDYLRPYLGKYVDM
ncbi:hypothetical protein K4F52_004605 [Lecanicillium sp. MT-2017a]|nr:hypothetical protein K4F52_004605 [Lecanicillium sp. MT-2017a]